MGIANRPTSRNVQRIVFCADPDVTPRNKADRGWVLAQQAHVMDGATVLEVKPLDVDQRAYCNDGAVKGAYTISLRRSRSAIVSVDGEPGDEAAERLLDALDSDDIMLCLGAYVDDITNGDDPQARQRRFFRAPEPEPADALVDRETEPPGGTDS